MYESSYYARTLATAYGHREKTVELEYRSEETDAYFVVSVLAGTDRAPGEPALTGQRFAAETDARLAFVRAFEVPVSRGGEAAEPSTSSV